MTIACECHGSLCDIFSESTFMQDLGENEDKIYARLLRSVQATPSVVDIQNKVCIIHG